MRESVHEMVNGRAVDRRPPPRSALDGLCGRSGWENLPGRVRPSRLWLLAAGDRDELLASLRTAGDRLAAGDDLDQVPSPRPGRHRLAIVAADRADLAAKIELAAGKLSGAAHPRLALQGSVYYAARQPAAEARTVFLFPGQGSQHPGMLGELCLLFPRVRAWLEELDRTLADLPVPAPSLLAYPPPGGLTEDERSLLGSELLGLRGGAQLSLIANLALFEVVSDLGIACDAMLGHSNGEHAALFASRTFRADRSRLFAAVRSMVEEAIRLPPPEPPERVITVSSRDRRLVEGVLAAAGDGLHLAMINCPSQVVLAGRADTVAAAGRRLAAAGAIVVPVPLDRAYHTPLFSSWGSWLRELYRHTDAGSGRRTLYSSMTASPYPEQAEGIRDLAAAQWTRTVDFERVVRRLYDDGVRVFVEVGPGSKLTGFVGDVLRDREHVAVATSSPQHPAVQQLQRLLAVLFVNGRPLDLGSPTALRLLRPLEASALAPPAPEPAVPEPPRWPPVPGSQPEGRTGAGAPDPRLGLLRAHHGLMREFLDSQARVLRHVARRSAAEGAPRPGSAAFEWPLLGEPVALDRHRLETVRRFDLERDPLLRDHSLGGGDGLPVLPFTFTLEVVAEAALRLAGGRDGGGAVVSEISAARGYRWLALDRGSLSVRIVAEADPARPRRTRVRVFELAGDREHLAFESEAEVAAVPAAVAAPAPRPGGSGLGPCRRWSVDDFYRDYAFHGPSFRGIREIVGIGGEEVEADVAALPRPAPGGRSRAPELLVDPALLDCAGQLVGFWLLEGGRRDFGIFPFHLKRLRLTGRRPEPGRRCRARARVLWRAHGATSADVVFADEHGPLYALEGFEQRFVAFPPALSRALFGAAETARDRFVSSPGPPEGGLAARVLEDLPHRFLEESWGIWGRALAHRALSSVELDEWYDLKDCSVAWLLSRLVAKETVRSWAAEAHGLDLPLAEVGLSEGGSGAFAVRHPALPAGPALQIDRDGERIVVRLKRS